MNTAVRPGLRGDVATVVASRCPTSSSRAARTTRSTISASTRRCRTRAGRGSRQLSQLPQGALHLAPAGPPAPPPARGSAPPPPAWPAPRTAGSPASCGGPRSSASILPFSLASRAFSAATSKRPAIGMRSSNGPSGCLMVCGRSGRRLRHDVQPLQAGQAPDPGRLARARPLRQRPRHHGHVDAPPAGPPRRWRGWSGCPVTSRLDLRHHGLVRRARCLPGSAAWGTAPP